MPVVILTARGDVRATVAGLEGGADDYITKPFRYEELLAGYGSACEANGRRSRPYCV